MSDLTIATTGRDRRCAGVRRGSRADQGTTWQRLGGPASGSGGSRRGTDCGERRCRAAHAAAGDESFGVSAGKKL